MGQYNGSIITTQGQALIAEALAGETLQFVSVKTSDYAYPAGTDLAALTDLESIRQTVAASNVDAESNSVKVSALFYSTGLTAGYSIQALGIYAKIEGTAGDPVLFSVATAVSPDYMPAEDAQTPVSIGYNFVIGIRNASSISFTVTPAGVATVAMLENYVQKSAVVNNLTTIEAGYVLDARQGTALNASKLDANKVVNNLTTTAAGFALDARMGQQLNNTKVASENSGTQKKVASIYHLLDSSNRPSLRVVGSDSSSFDIAGNYQDIWHQWGDGSGIYYTKQSGIVFLSIVNLPINLSADTWTKIMSDYIPAAYRLRGGQVHGTGFAMTSTSTSARAVGLFVDANGDIQAFSSAAMTNYRLYATISYPANVL